MSQSQGARLREMTGIQTTDLRVHDDLDVKGQLQGQITVQAGGHLVLSGMARGDVCVCTGGRAEVTGVMHGNVRVQAGAHVSISGMVHGQVRNEGGEVDVTGLVSGRTV